MAIGTERLGPNQSRFGMGVLVFVAILSLLAGFLISWSIGGRPAARDLDMVGAEKVTVAANSSGFTPRRRRRRPER